ILPYFLLAVLLGGNLAKLVPLVGDTAEELAKFGATAGDAALQAAIEAPNLWYQNLIDQKERDLCAGAKGFLETVERQSTDSEKQLSDYRFPVAARSSGKGNVLWNVQLSADDFQILVNAAPTVQILVFHNCTVPYDYTKLFNAKLQTRLRELDLSVFYSALASTRLHLVTFSVNR
ncbi:hypothetical protein BC938DRAFT_481104, partial [Jimgerdemannia flammicorona]